MADAALPPARALLREGDYLRFWLARCLSGLGQQVQSVAMGWQVYELSRRTLGVGASALNVSFIGLATFAPLMLLALPGGRTADRRDRRQVLIVCLTAETTLAAALVGAAIADANSVALLIAVAFLFGCVRAFRSPAMTALGPMLVPRPLLPRAIAWNSLAWQSASAVGPALGGLLVAASPRLAYAFSFGLYLVGGLGLLLIRARPGAAEPPARAGLIREGLAYVWRNKIVFGAISLDLAAVVLGGATALLPAFARDILHVGARGFGILRAAPAVGATLAGVMLSAHPVRSGAGWKMLAGVGVYGAATIVFGLSRIFWLSLVALAMLGAADMVSVFVRNTLIQIVTPNPMRGRVAAVSTLFTSASNEVGEFESGLAARLLGVIGSAVFGGAGALAATGAWSWLFPALRRADRLE